MGKFVLHDLAARAPQSCWSLNPWKTRLLLNFKGLDYETNWVEYPDIANLLKDHTPENEITLVTKKPYTLPAVTFPDGKWLQDSKKIAVEIEKQHPQPSANLDSPYQARIEDLVPKFFGQLMPILFNQVPKNILNEPGVKYWIQDRGSRVGTFDLEAYEKEHGGEVAYEKAKPALDEITDMLKENEGPFFEGKTVSYADFVWLGVLLCLKRVCPKDYEGAIGKSKDRSVHEGLIEACAEWTKRNDY